MARPKSRHCAKRARSTNCVSSRLLAPIPTSPMPTRSAVRGGWCEQPPLPFRSGLSEALDPAWKWELGRIERLDGRGNVDCSSCCFLATSRRSSSATTSPSKSLYVRPAVATPAHILVLRIAPDEPWQSPSCACHRSFLVRTDSVLNSTFCLADDLPFVVCHR